MLGVKVGAFINVNYTLTLVTYFLIFKCLCC
jgi:hypothetical protein